MFVFSRYDSIKHSCLLAIDQHPPFNMTAHCAGQYNFLEIPSLSNQILNRIPVAYADHVLLDDRPLVQILRRIVRRRPDDFHAAFIGCR